MKSVGNLTDFVRHHMIEPFDVAQRIEALIAHFNDLNRAHEAVLKAKRQVELLAPLIADCDRHGEETQGLETLRTCRDALRPWFAGLKLELLDHRLQLQADEHARLDAQRTRRLEQRDREQLDVDRLKLAVSEQGGDRLEQLDVEIREQERERDRRQQRASRRATR